MRSDIYTPKKISQLFGQSISKTCLFMAEENEEIPRGKRCQIGAINSRGWDMTSLPSIGEKWGFMKKWDSPLCMAIFTTKGGVLKTTLSLNISRMAALHNIRTCVIGLDMQGDITSAMGHDLDLEDSNDLDAVIKKLNETKGLADIFNRTARIEDVIRDTEIPTLKYIPETPELAALNESLGNINRREYWLKEKIIKPLKEKFDLIILDCAPNWNRLITNALVSSDLLISPLECKINNFRNFKVFRYFLDEFKREMQINFDTLFVPTKYSTHKKLSREIWQWYKENVSALAETGIRESVYGEEATALRWSVLEHASTKAVAHEMRKLLLEISVLAEKRCEKIKYLAEQEKNKKSLFSMTV